MENIVTMDLSKFGYRELTMAAELLNAMVTQGLPEGFEDDGVQVAFNTYSGFVFLTNSDYQVAMMNGDKLEMWYTLPYSGEEGFKEDFEGRGQDEFNQEDWEFLVENGIVEEED